MTRRLKSPANVLILTLALAFFFSVVSVVNYRASVRLRNESHTHDAERPSPQPVRILNAPQLWQHRRLRLLNLHV